MRWFIRIAALGLLLGSASLALAQTSDTATSSRESVLARLSYPITELGNCDSREACKLYCDESSHTDACFAYAQKAGLMTKEKIDAAKAILRKQGPGGCASGDECKIYCSDSAHGSECLSFAEKHQIIASSTVALIRKFNQGEGPGACKSAGACTAYCSDPANESECRSFAEDNGLMSRTGSSTPDRARAILASTTPGIERGMELRSINSSTTPPGMMKGEAPRSAGSSTELKRSTLPVHPASKNDSLGASVLRGFVWLLGF